MFQLAALFRTTVAGLLAMAEDTPQPGVQTAAMLWRKSNVQLDETARDGIQGFTNFLDFYASLASRMRAGRRRHDQVARSFPERATASTPSTPSARHPRYGSTSASGRGRSPTSRASAKRSASPSTGRTWAVT